MTSRSLGHRAPLLWVLLPLMVGLVFAKLQWLPLGSVTWALTALTCASVSLFWRRAWGPFLVISIFLTGATFYEVHRHRLPDWDALPPREVRVTLAIDRTFPPKPEFKTIGGLGRITAAEAHLTELIGQRVYFSVSKSADTLAAIPTSEWAVTGMLETLPRSAPDNSFEGYLVNQGINFKLTRARITAAVSPAHSYARFLDRAQHRMHDILGYGLEHVPEQAGVLRAMLLGQQQDLSNDQKTSFRHSGTMHLFSISGLHIAVIAMVVYVILSIARFPTWARFITSGIFLWLYVDATGSTPSAVRAWLMVMFVQAAYVFRQPSNATASLVASAVAVLVLQPLQLFTASFQLSYGIVSALLLLGLPLGDYWNEKLTLFRDLPKVTWTWRHHSVDWAWRSFLNLSAIGLSTSLFSLLSGVLIFNLLTPVSLIANLVLIPLGSLVIVSGFLSILSGLVGLSWLVLLFNHASALLLLFIDYVLRGFVQLPGAFGSAAYSANWIGYTAIAGLLGLIFGGYSHGWTLKRGGFWPPFVFTLLVLLLGARLVPAS